MILCKFSHVRHWFYCPFSCVTTGFGVDRSFLHPGDPFSVPSHLREEVADFEEQYNSRRHGGHYKMILDNNPDPTKESLYE